MLPAPIRLTAHARERVDAGEVKVKWIEAAVRGVDWTAPDPKPPGITRSFRSIAAFDGRVLRVAHRPDDGHLPIVTAFFDRGAKQ